MKKLFLALVVSSAVFGVVTEANAWGRGRRCGYKPVEESECGAPPCCKRVEEIEVIVPAKKVCGWVCPADCDTLPADARG